jgi:hypothetical protein
MENQNNSNLKAIIVVLLLLLLGSIGYMFKMSADAKQQEVTLSNTLSEKEALVKDLEALKKSYDVAIAENTSLSDELIAEREKVVKLIEELKKSSDDANTNRKFRNQYKTLESKMAQLIKQNELLVAENEMLKMEIDSTNTILLESKEYNQVLIGQNEALTKTVEKASKLTISNLSTSAYKLRSSGKEIATDRAKRADLLKISFTIAENAVAKSGDKLYYIQVIDSKNNVLGEKQTIYFGEQVLHYSFITSVKYENSSVKVTENLAGDNFEKGLYTVNIFDKNELLSSTNFSLK